MFRLGVSDHIMIAHSIADPTFGPAQRLHGATYAIELELRAAQVGVHHVVMDIGLLRSTLRAVLDELDYGNLDDHPGFKNVASTTERVVEYIANRVAAAIHHLAAESQPPKDATLCVLARESPVAYAAYERPLALE